MVDKTPARPIPGNPYASQTEVSPDRSRAEIERILRRYGATQFGYGWQTTQAMIGFRYDRWMIRFVLPLPTLEEMGTTPGGRRRFSAKSKLQAHDQETRRRWRSLALAIKAKLDAVVTGIADFEIEFQPYIVLPNGKTAGEWLRPQISKAYDDGKMPPMMLGSGDDGR